MNKRLAVFINFVMEFIKIIMNLLLSMMYKAAQFVFFNSFLLELNVECVYYWYNDKKIILKH